MNSIIMSRIIQLDTIMSLSLHVYGQLSFMVSSRKAFIDVVVKFCSNWNITFLYMNSITMSRIIRLDIIMSLSLHVYGQLSFMLSLRKSWTMWI